MPHLKMIGLALGATLAFAAHARAQDIAVAVAGPMTGGESPFGMQMKNGAELAVDDLNAAGGVLGIAGVPLPLPELAIALSAVVLGAAVALRLRVPFALAAVVVGIFAIFHGHAHGVELPHAANPLAYGIGFVTATGMLHLCGIAIGTLIRWPAGDRAIRGLGLAIAATGCLFLVRSLGVGA